MKKLSSDLDYETLENRIKRKEGSVDHYMGNWDLNSLVKSMVNNDPTKRVSATNLA